MATNRKPAQLQTFFLAGSGVVDGSTEIVLTAFKDIDGNLLAMSNFGTKCYITLEPNNSSQEEQASFTNIVQNDDGSATLTGVSNVEFLYPYTETSGLFKSHPGGSKLIVSNTSGYYSDFANTQDIETISQVWTFDSTTGRPKLSTDVDTAVNEEFVDFGQLARTSFAGTVNASTVQKGIVQLSTQAQLDAKTGTGSTGAALVATPALMRSTLTNDYVIATGTANAIAIAPSPAITAYTTGQIFSFKAIATNTGAVTIAVSGLASPKNIFKNSQFALAAGDIKNGSIVTVEYDGTQFQMLSQQSTARISQAGTEIYATSATGNSAYTVALVPAISAYAAGLVVNFKPDAGGGHATLNVNSLGAKNIYKYTNGNLGPVITGDILANQVVQVEYDGTQFQMVSQPASVTRYQNGVTTRAGNAGAGSQTIAHGLGRIPTKLRITARCVVSNVFLSGSDGVYNGTTTSMVYFEQNSSASFMGTDSTNIIKIVSTSGGDDNHATATLDATNINLTWAISGIPNAATIQIMWEVEG